MATLRILLPTALLAAVVMLGAPLSAQQRGTTAIVDVAVVRVEEGDLLRRQTVIVQDGVIVEVGPVDQVEVPRGATRIEGVLRFLAPGLIDTDGVLPHPGGPHRPEDVLPLYLARGVTTVLGVRTHASQDQLQRRVEGGNPPGPRLLLAGSITDGNDGGAGVPPLRPDAVPSQPVNAAAPLEVLRALTVEAAGALGLAGEVGRIEPGARADLVMLDHNPLESADNLRRVHGVMVHGRWWNVADMERRMVSRARDLVLGYYQTMPTAGVRSSGCTGVTLQDCYGGDSECSTSWNCRSDVLPLRRAELLTQMDLLGAVVRRSDWIVGQRVNFAVKNGDLDAAWAAAESCGASLWWCQALRGYVRHLRAPGSGDPQLDSAFLSAPPGTPAWAEPRIPSAGDRGVHCEWTDLTTLVTGMMAQQHARLGCGFEGAFHQRFWWLADPLWSVPGNERRSEHIVRNIQMRLHDEILRERRSHHPQEHHVMVLPAGLPNSWRPVTRVGGRAAGGGGAPRLLEGGSGYVNGGYSFTPDERRFYDPSSTTSDDWALVWDRGREVRVQGRGATAVRIEERMITPERWYSLEHQTALLWRDGRLLVLAAARPPVLRSSFEDVSAALAMGRPLDLHVEIVPARIQSSGVMRASVELDAPRPARDPASVLFGTRDHEWLASIEVVGDGFRGRARHGAPAPLLTDGFGLSDLVLVSDRFELDRLPLLEAMLPSPALVGHASVGVYFEVYGVLPDEPLQMAVSGERTNLSLMQRLGGALRLRTESSLAVAWLEAAETPEPGAMTRHLTVDLSGLDDGDYELMVTVTRADGTSASASRVVRVTRPR